ncbi:hypothetical protein JB92DRAFT_649239 [Gautieria morchelliformis]|nr:hypothetical protein JB92DRAFT_649239 [Gautieria morchelliformis]
MEAGVGSGVAAPAKVELPDPSPSQPTLGKRTRGLLDTPDVSVNEDGAEQENEGHRVTKPLRKRPRLHGPEKDAGPSSFVGPGPDGPECTSTPRHRSKSPPGLFTAGGQAPTPFAGTADTDGYLDLEDDDLAMPRAEPSSTVAVAPVEGAPCTPPRAAVAGPSSNMENTFDSVDPMDNRGIFGGPLPVTYTPSSALPWPLVPSTPSNSQDIPELSEPSNSEAVGNPATIPQGVALPCPKTPTHRRDRGRYDWGTPVKALFPRMCDLVEAPRTPTQSKTSALAL